MPRKSARCRRQPNHLKGRNRSLVLGKEKATAQCTHLIGVNDEIVACDVVVLPDSEIVRDGRDFSPDNIRRRVLERGLVCCEEMGENGSRNLDNGTLKTDYQLGVESDCARLIIENRARI